MSPAAAAAPATGPEIRAFLKSLFDAAVAAALPQNCLPPHLPERPAKGRTLVLGAGKAAAAMAQAVEAAWPGPLEGCVVCPHGSALPLRSIECREAAHPVPDAAGAAAAARLLELAGQAGEGDLVLVLLSGGASALTPAPPPGISLAEKQEISRALLRRGAAIGDLNTVRKHLSLFKGGRLARAAAPARVVTLAISDVAGDDPAVIGSGPTVADPSTVADARAALARYRVDLPPAAAAWLDDPAAESPKPGDADLARAELKIVATAADSLQAAAAVAERAGVRPLILSDRFTGDARALAAMHAEIALSAVARGLPAAAPLLLLSGGEVTVDVGGQGRGGPNGEFALALARALDAASAGASDAVSRIAALACDTDGADGPSGLAGAFVLSDSIARARAAGIDPAAAQAENDSYGLFLALGDALETGPTQTNVNDFRAVLVLPPQERGA
ncbi:glycerate kinase [Marinibaculum pumilum]|uniref:Glycerate kinase n=1 Tax=Marinibaculum pumilum TaxID=1766165 RepID=A0ABV7L2Q9_9PROT